MPFGRISPKTTVGVGMGITSKKSHRRSNSKGYSPAQEYFDKDNSLALKEIKILKEKGLYDDAIRGWLCLRKEQHKTTYSDYKPHIDEALGEELSRLTGNAKEKHIQRLIQGGQSCLSRTFDFLFGRGGRKSRKHRKPRKHRKSRKSRK